MLYTTLSKERRQHWDADGGAVPHGEVRFSDRSNVELQVIGREPLMSEFNTHLLEKNTIRQGDVEESEVPGIIIQP